MHERWMTPTQRHAMNRVLREVEFERMGQHFARGEQNRPSFSARWLAEPSEFVELANQAKQATDDAAKAGDLCYADILSKECCEAFAEQRDEDLLRAELIQVAAVAVAWIEAIDRRKQA